MPGQPGRHRGNARWRPVCPAAGSGYAGAADRKPPFREWWQGRHPAVRSSRGRGTLDAGCAPAAVVEGEVKYGWLFKGFKAASAGRKGMV